ncbi:MAG: sigma factor for late transcription [Gammaproteobacteria bacterium]|nr:sigma factor for late transcription [Gammaproteobacteria bacterium]|tara:strand:+ start:2470 stop:3042 length:573 start_codon:yes stop_codon:yes gene_type:complete
MPEKIKPRDKPHYVNNRDFSNAVVDYCKHCITEDESGNERPVVTDYIATCFMKICEGLSHKSNFVRYTYRDEMVMDGVENCLRAIHNYNIETTTRTGKPNAFAYFTQIAYFAFIRRITKEKKQQDIKFHFLEQADIESFITSTDTSNPIDQAYVDVLRNKIASIKKKDDAIKEFGKVVKEKKAKGVELHT